MVGLALLFLTAFVLIALIGSFVIVLRIVRPRRKTLAIALGQGLPTDPADLALNAEPVTFHLPDKHTTPGHIIKGQRTDGPTILLLHGHSDAIPGALRFAEQLVRYARHIVVFDWPGHGDCTAPWMTCGTREPDDALAVIEQLPGDVRSRRIVLFGYSLGGQIAIKTAGLYPDRFAGVVADGPYRFWDSPIRMRLKDATVPAWPFMPIVAIVFHFTGLIKQFDRAAFASKITAPLLIVHGSEDRICPAEEGRQLADAAPQGIYALIEQGRHNCLFDQDHQAYHAALASFFESIQTDTLPR